MSYQIKRRDQFLATTAILGSMSLFATEAQAACTETFAGSGIWDCTDSVTTQSPTPATGGALDVSTTSVISIVAPTGNALSLINAIGDTNITYLDIFTSTITGNDNGIFSTNNGTGNTSLTTGAIITGTTLDGISVSNTSLGSNIDITTNGTVLGSNIGIDVSNSGTGGTTSVFTTGGVTGTSDYAINIFQDTGTAGVTVNTGAGALLGGRKAILVDNDGNGSTIVTTAGNVTGTTEDAIYIDNAATTTGATVNANAGIVTGQTNGIYIDHKGTGDAIITGAADITGTTLDGVFVDNTALGSNISITTNGTVLGNDRGIRAKNDGGGTTSVTTAGNVTGTTLDAIYINNAATTTGATVNANAGTITGQTNGIYIDHKGTGEAIITGAANITGATLDGVFVDNTASGSNISITTNGTVLGDDRGINVNNDGTGTTSVITTGTVAGTTAEAINVSNTGTATNISVNIGAGAVTGANIGIDVSNSGTGGTTSVFTTGGVTGTSDYAINIFQDTGTAGVTVNTGAGALLGGRKAILVDNDGNGSTIVTTAGNVTGTTEDAIYIDNAATTTGATVNANAGIVTGQTNGIYIDHKGTGDAIITGAADITGTTLDGVFVDNTALGSNISITTNGTVLGNDRGIRAKNDGGGTTSVTTAGNVTGTTLDAIYINNAATTTGATVNANAGTITGQTNGIYIDHKGTGEAIITGAANITGATLDGVFVDNTASGSNISITTNGTVLGNDRGIRAKNDGGGTTSVTTAGNVTGTTLDAIYINNAGSTTGATVNANAGTITGQTNGIYIDHKGTGEAIITGAANITGATLDGVFVDNTASGSNISITTNGTVLGDDRGIRANNVGTGFTSITTTGAITATNNEAILAENNGTSTSLTVNAGAGAILGKTYGIYADNDGNGATSVTTSGAVMGTDNDGVLALGLLNSDGMTINAGAGTITGNNHGIYANHSGVGAISITSAGAVTGTATTGIRAQGSGSTTDITISGGAGTVNGGQYGIHTDHNGTGALNITTLGAVAGGTEYGIRGYSLGNDQTINTGAGTVSGGKVGIHAQQLGSGDLLISTIGAVTGAAQQGIYAFNNATSTDVTVNTGPGAVTGNTYGIHANSLSTGDISISTIGTVVGTTEHGIYVDHDGIGSSSVNVMGTVMAAKNAIYAEHSVTVSNMAITSGAGNISGGLSGISARNLGSGTTTVTTSSGIVTGAADHGVYALAQGSNVTVNAGTGAITGNTHAIYVDNTGSGDTVVITSGAVNGAVNGVMVSNGVASDDVTINTGIGAVTAGNFGINSVNSGTGSTTISTAGDVTATSGSGISAANAGTSLNIDVNGGTVSGTVSGIHAMNTGSGITTITNTGTVTGGTNSLLIGSGSTTVNNSGTLNGAVLFNSGDDTFSLAAGSTFSSDADGGTGDDVLNVAGDHTLGTITEFETVNISNGTVLWNSAASNVGDLTLNNASLSFGGVAGSLSLDINSMLSGTGAFDDLFVSGVISPGNSAGTINVAGNYTMEDTAVYHAEIYADGTSDLIEVAGAVALSGKLEIDIVGNPEDYDNKGIYTILSAGGPITGNFATVTSENTTTTLYVMHHLRNNNVEVDLIDPTEYFAPAGETSNQKAASVILPHLAISSEEAEKLFHADDVEINEKLEELSGNRHATMAGIIASDGTEYVKTVVSQVDTVDQGNVSTWIKSYGLDSKAKTDGNARGYDHVSKGIAVGFGVGLFDTITTGVHGGMTWSDATFGADKGEGRSKEAGAYIAGDFNILKFAAAYSHGWHDVKMSRFLNLLGTAQNDTATKSHKYEFEASIPLRINQVTVEPMGGINQTKVSGVSISETGVNIANLEGSTEDFTSAQVHGGLRFSAHLPVGSSSVIMPSAQVKYVQEIGDLKGIMTAAFEAVPTTDITSRGLTSDKNRIEVDAGITFKTKGNLSFNLGYRGVYSRNLKSHGGRAGISIVF